MRSVLYRFGAMDRILTWQAGYIQVGGEMANGLKPGINIGCKVRWTLVYHQTIF